MKTLFPGFYKLDAEAFDQLWKNAVFVFDTNVLLNLYRYHETTTTTLLQVIERLSGRVWLPYHVGLEFQRNRLKVIAEQHQRFTEVRKIIDEQIAELQNKLDRLQLKTRHSHIDPDKLIGEIVDVKGRYVTHLDELEKASIKLSSDDLIRAKLDLLFSNKIGEAPDQATINDLSKEGEERYKHGIPPGFRDAGKDDADEDSFSYGGIVYRKKFGDLLIWKQLLKHAGTAQLHDIIFVTDDGKSDWWSVVKGKTIGARAELVEEIRRESKVERFHIYSTEAFLEYANQYLDANVAKDTIDEVREVVAQNRLSHRSHAPIHLIAESAERGVYEWLTLRYNEVEPNNGFPDFIVEHDSRRIGFEVRAVRDARMAVHRIEDHVYRAYHSIHEGRLEEVTLVYVLTDMTNFGRSVELLRRRLVTVFDRMAGAKGAIKAIVGVPQIIDPNGVMQGFILCEELS